MSPRAPGAQADAQDKEQDAAHTVQQTFIHFTLGESL